MSSKLEYSKIDLFRPQISAMHLQQNGTVPITMILVMLTHVNCSFHRLSVVYVEFSDCLLSSLKGSEHCTLQNPNCFHCKFIWLL